jgi:HSP20 family protein
MSQRPSKRPAGFRHGAEPEGHGRAKKDKCHADQIVLAGLAFEYPGVCQNGILEGRFESYFKELWMDDAGMGVAIRRGVIEKTCCLMVRRLPGLRSQELQGDRVMGPIIYRTRPYNGSALFAPEFSRALDRWLGEGTETDGLGKYPVDVREDANHLYVDAEVPGFKAEEINVTFEKGVLSITAERKPVTEKTDAQTHLAERRYTKVSRSFTIPGPVDENKIEAKLENGVLHLTLHKREEAKPRRIEVK